MSHETWSRLTACRNLTAILVFVGPYEVAMIHTEAVNRIVFSVREWHPKPTDQHNVWWTFCQPVVRALFANLLHLLLQAFIPKSKRITSNVWCKMSLQQAPALPVVEILCHMPWKSIYTNLCKNIEDSSFTLIPLTNVNIFQVKILKLILKRPFFGGTPNSTNPPNNSPPPPAHLHPPLGLNRSSGWKVKDVKDTVWTVCCKFTTFDTGQTQIQIQWKSEKHTYIYNNK